MFKPLAHFLGYIVLKLLILNILLDLKLQLFFSRGSDRKYSKFPHVSNEFKAGRGGKTLAWLLLRKDSKLLENLHYAVSKGDQRESFLLLKTLFEDVAVAFGICIHWEFGKRYKPDLKKSIAFLNSEVSLPLEYEFTSFNQLYGHLNRFSHFNFKTFQGHVFNFIQPKPDIGNQSSSELHYLLCIDVYIHLQQCYFPFKEMFSVQKNRELKYFFKDSSGLLAGIMIPANVQRRISIWISIYTFLQKQHLLPYSSLKSLFE